MFGYPLDAFSMFVMNSYELRDRIISNVEYRISCGESLPFAITNALDECDVTEDDLLPGDMEYIYNYFK
jgi:hypothetical protein